MSNRASCVLVRGFAVPEPQARPEFDLVLARLAGDLFDALQKPLGHVGEVVFQNPLLAREVIQQVAGRHAGLMRHPDRSCAT